MAAANFKGRVSAGRFGKRLLNQIWTAPPSPALSSPALLSSREKAVHVSSYDKNVEEHVRPSLLPDHVIDAKSDKYWGGPHPITGVFGPADVGGAEQARGGAKPAVDTGSGPSALDQTVWFRPQEVDKAPLA